MIAADLSTQQALGVDPKLRQSRKYEILFHS